MKLAFAALLAAALVAPQASFAWTDSQSDSQTGSQTGSQTASDLQSAAPSESDGGSAASSDQRGRQLLDQMVQALGGQAWLDRKTEQMDGHGSAFFHGEPDPYIIEFHETDRFLGSGQPEAQRVGFLTSRGMIMPGKKIDVVQIWKDGKGIEVTWKGKDELPKDQVTEYYQRRKHSVESVVRDWIKAPGVMIIVGGQEIVNRRMVNKVTVLSANNDSVSIDLDADTHLPVRRTYQYRDPQFHDFDEDVEEYDDYHTFDGLPTPLTVTRYKNGDMVSQRYLTKVAFNQPLDANTFDENSITIKLKK